MNNLYSKHFKIIENKANKVSFLIQRIMKKEVSIKSCTTLIKSLLLPIITYGIQLCRPTKKYYEIFTSIIAKPIKRCLGIGKTISNISTLIEVGIIPLQILREKMLIKLHRKYLLTSSNKDSPATKQWKYSYNNPIKKKSNKTENKIKSLTPSTKYCPYPIEAKYLIKPNELVQFNHPPKYPNLPWSTCNPPLDDSNLSDKEFRKILKEKELERTKLWLLEQTNCKQLLRILNPL